jgi:hypothetical protein
MLPTTTTTLTKNEVSSATSRDWVTLGAAQTLKLNALDNEYAAAAAVMPKHWQALLASVNAFARAYVARTPADLLTFSIVLKRSARFVSMNEVAPRNPPPQTPKKPPHQVSQGAKGKTTPAAGKPPAPAADGSGNRRPRDVQQVLAPPSRRIPSRAGLGTSVAEIAGLVKRKASSRSGLFCEACCLIQEPPFAHNLAQCPYFQQIPPYADL